VPVDGAVYAAPAEQRRVRGVDDRVRPLPGDIALYERDPHSLRLLHGCGYSIARITGTLTTVNRLGDLERAIMDVLWETDAPLTVREVSARLTERNLAHTTVMTVLDRLAKKGFAKRQRDGRAWRYCPAATRETYVTELMLTALDQTGDRTAALTRFAQSVSGIEAEVLRDALEVLEGDGGGDEGSG
jgi:predicted transcriptional regulator